MSYPSYYQSDNGIIVNHALGHMVYVQIDLAWIFTKKARNFLTLTGAPIFINIPLKP